MISRRRLLVDSYLGLGGLALLGTDDPPRFTDVQFARPVVVPEKASVKSTGRALRVSKRTAGSCPRL